MNQEEGRSRELAGLDIVGEEWNGAVVEVEAGIYEQRKPKHLIGV